MTPAVRVDGLSKKYRIGTRATYGEYRTLRESLINALQKPWSGLATCNTVAKKQNAGDFWALRDVSFEVQAGEVVGIIGRNGAGKSTLLKILSRITEPTHGRAILNGRVSSLLEVGTGFHPELTGRENIYLNGSILGMTRKEIHRKFDEIVAFSEIDQFLDMPVKRYSSGMYVRLAFAVAAHLSPEILIIDEVLAVGDAAFQTKCLGKMHDIAGEGRTVLFVSHNVGVISNLCDRVVQLASGTLRNDGPTHSVLADYLSGTALADNACLAELRCIGYGRDVRFTSIQLSSGDHRNVSFGEALKIELQLQSDINTNELTVGASIFDVTGLCVGTLFSERPIVMKTGGTTRVRLRIANLTLAPGSYYAGVSIGTGGYSTPRKDLDIVVGAPRFDVTPITGGQTNIANWQRSWGPVVIRDVQCEVD